MTYKLGLGPLDDAVGDIESGTNILVSGPPMAGIDDFTETTLSYAVNQGEGVIYVTTKDSGKDILDDYKDNEDYDPDRFGIVDCVSRSQDMDQSFDEENVRMASSPNDLTGIGINVSQFLDEHWNEKGIEKNRIFLNSISTLLMYSDLQTVFRFLHVFTGRVGSVDGIGIFTIDSEMHDKQVYSTLKPLFDGFIEIRQNDQGRQIRAMGLTSSPTDWIPLEIENEV